MAWNDSRWSALRHYRKRAFRLLFNTSTFLGNLVLALGLTWLLDFPSATPAMELVLFILILSVGLWLTEAIPPFAVGILIIAYLVFMLGSDVYLAEAMPVEGYVNTWTSNVIWLLLGGFFLAEGMRQVGLDRALFRWTVRQFGTKPTRLLFGLMTMTALASMVMSNTATAAMMIASILPMVRGLGREAPMTRSLLVGIPAAASVGGMGTIIGSTPNAIAVGALEGAGVEIGFVQWMAFGVPISLTLVVGFWYWLSKRYVPKVKTLDLSFLESGDASDQEDGPTAAQRRTVLGTLALTIGLWSTEALHGIPLAATSAVPIVLLTLSRIISADEVRGLPWDTLMLVAGGLALGRAIVDTGLAAHFLGIVEGLGLPTLLLGLLVVVLTLGASNVMSNTAASSILIPIALGLPQPYGVAVPLAVAMVASCALFLPVSTPPNAIAYSTNLLEQRDFRIGGLFFGLSSPVLAYPLAVLVAVLLLG